MKNIVHHVFTTWLILSTTVNAFSQNNLNSEHNTFGKRMQTMLWSKMSDGVYLGASHNWELGTRVVGAEIKASTFYYTLFSCYAGYGNVTNNEAFNLPDHKITLGANYLIFGFELSSYFGNNKPFFIARPNLVIDLGNFSVNYGIMIGKRIKNVNSFSIKYSLYLNALFESKKYY